MKTFKTLLICCLIFSSCHKKINDRKLDGEWVLTEGSSTDENSSPIFDGTNATYYKNSTGTSVYTINYTESFIFNKKKNTYTNIYSKSEPNENSYQVNIYKKVDNNYLLYKMFTQKDNVTSTTTITGKFLINGIKKDDIKYHSQIEITQSFAETIWHHNLTYFDGAEQITDFSNLYIDYNFEGLEVVFEPIASNKETKALNGPDLTDNAYHNLWYSMHWNVIHIKKGVMKIECVKLDGSTNGTKMTLTQK